MKDVELRGVILEKFYEVRNQEPSLVDPRGLPGLELIEPDEIRVFNICEQLDEHGLLRWQSMRGLQTYGGMGHISARGVDVVEGTAAPPIAITLHSISVNQSSNVQIGDSNIQDVRATPIEIHDLTRLVTELAEHLDELNLDARHKQRAEAQIAALRAEIAGDEPDPAIVRQTGRTLRNITEGAIGSMLAAAAQPPVWQWVHHMLASF